MDFGLAGKKVLVTGSTRGIGFATASLLHQEGAEVLFSGTNQQKLDDILQQFPERSHALACDLNNSSAIDEFTKEAMKKLSEIDVLVCNAGIARGDKCSNLTESEWDEVMNVNLKACFLLNQKFGNHMKKRKRGSVINITSVLGFLKRTGGSNYAASKAGLTMMTRNFAEELGEHGVRFNCVAPGLVETEITKSLSKDRRIQREKQIKEHTPLRRYGTECEIANTILFLASNLSSYITGETIHVNGGLGMF